MRHREQILIICGVLSVLRRSLTCSGAVTATALIWLRATVRALTAERRATLRVADRLHAAVCGLGHSASVAAERGSGRGLGVDGVGLAAPAARLAVRAVRLDDLDAGRGEVPGEARTVGSGALHAHTPHRAPTVQPTGELVIAAGVGRELRRA